MLVRVGARRRRRGWVQVCLLVSYRPLALRVCLKKDACAAPGDYQSTPAVSRCFILQLTNACGCLALSALLRSQNRPLLQQCADPRGRCETHGRMSEGYNTPKIGRSGPTSPAASEKTTSSRAVLAALRALQDKIARLEGERAEACLLYTSPSPRDLSTSRMPSSA